MVFGQMKRTYSIVSIDGITGKRLHEFLSTHKEQYPSVISFVDAAVTEKLDREIEPERISVVQEQPITPPETVEEKVNIDYINENGGGL